LLWQGGSAGSPYGYFYANLSKNAYIPAGQDASRTGNWEHFSDAKATTLLNQWKVTLNITKHKVLAPNPPGIFLPTLPLTPPSPVSSAPAGRRTAPIPPIASTRRSPSTAPRSSRPSPTTSSRSRPSAREGRPADPRIGTDHRRTGTRPPRPPVYPLATTDALV